MARGAQDDDRVRVAAFVNELADDFVGPSGDRAPNGVVGNQFQNGGRGFGRQQVLEAVRNDIAEAQENPSRPLGIDLLSLARYSRFDQSTWHRT
jgi:hypothetical protein